MATIYICGDTALQNEECNTSEVGKVKAKLKNIKCAVVAPSDMPFTQMNWSDTLQNRIELIKKSQAVYVMPNWKESVMARIELTVAMDLKLYTLFHPASHKEIKQILTTLGK